ncbi:arsenate reductase (glutaredoxin) [Arsukibacterium indicum]|uniref:Arsenate reductase n=1 Tax=Arsukibacterium indicum TaxID=2848612 RepID=A0ABS6MQE2_9GAMM|nr:arsenate reductase (glutaredoxin) [Arsukibacterium indicum]MBV2131043.1 arsenate reductase (glutaredoxin) [Arsukibacterium indicum]
MITIYHNPRCSKSRDALALLQQHIQQHNDLALNVVEYLKTPPTEAELTAILAKLKIPARSLLRTGETDYTSLQLNQPELTEQQLIKAMSQHPKLIERPIVVIGDRAAIGRPLSNVSAIL